MVRLENLTTESIDNVSMRLEPGLIYKVITKSDHTKRVLLDTILGIRKPLGGKVFLFGEDIWHISNRAVLHLLKNIGVVWNYGGLVSNLKVWENLSIPASYHCGVRPEALEGKILAIYKRLGRDVLLPEYMAKLPGPLPINEKKLISFVRAILIEPKVIIYDALFEGFDLKMLRSLSAIMADFHAENRNRTTVYVGSDQDSCKAIQEDILIKEEDRRLIVCQ